MEENELNKPCILLADDSRVIRKTIIKMLGPGFRVIEAEHGVVAWRALTQNSAIDVVVTDIDMPEMDGYALICKIRADEHPDMQDLPIVVITGAEDEITRERAYACGANDFILKPIESSQLIGCISNHLDNRGADGVVAKTEARAAPSTMPDLESVLAILRSPSPGAIDPHLLNISLRVMPVLDYANRRFQLGLDKEILMLKRRILDAR